MWRSTVVERVLRIAWCLLLEQLVRCNTRGEPSSKRGRGAGLSWEPPKLQQA